MMGLASWVHWLAWYIKCILFMLPTIGIMTAILKLGNVLALSDGIIVFGFLVLYGFSMVAFCFMLSTFFSMASVAATASGLLFFLSYAPYFVLSVFWDELSTGNKEMSCLLSNTCLGAGVLIITRRESAGTGVTVSNYNEPLAGDEFTMEQVLYSPGCAGDI